MKKFIEKESGRIVTVLTVDEAKKILEMYINCCLGKREVTVGRLNLVNYLGDFVKYSEKKDVSRFYDILVRDKENYEFSKNEQKSYESLINFFEIYNNIEKGEFDLNTVSNYISTAMTKKEALDLKIEKNETLNFEEKLNSIFFNKDFDLSILAKNACSKWEELLKQKIEQSEGGVDITLKEEIAYQDLLAICNGNAGVMAKFEIKKEPDIKEMQTESENVDELLKIDIDDNSFEENKKQIVEEKDENVVGPIIVNSVENKEDKKEERKEADDEIIGASTIRDVTQDVSLRDAATMFNDAIDGLSKENNSSEDTDTTKGTLRDQ